MLEAMEADDFDQLPSPFYTRSFLKKYAWAVELDDQIVLDAYDSGSMITYEEVDVDEDELTGRRRSSKKRRKNIIFTFILFYPFCFIDFNFCDLLCLELYSNSTRGAFSF